MISLLRKRVRYLWNCDCPPYRAIFRGRGGPKLMLVHHVSCDRKVHQRRTETLRITYEEIEEAKILVVAGTRGAGTALPADFRPAATESI